MTTLRVALFVEGSSYIGLRRGAPYLTEIWNKHLVNLVNGKHFECVVPISKKDIVAMDNIAHRPTGTEPLDLKLKRFGAGEKFDAAVVAWDLHPAWNELGVFCRWRETVRLLECLAASRALPQNWCRAAAAKVADYKKRPKSNQRPGPPRLTDGAVLPLCMEPEFEALLTANEEAVLRVLGLGSRPSGWPSGWGIGGTRRPSEEVMRVAIGSIPVQSTIRRQVRGGWREKKNEWGEYILRGLLQDSTGRGVLANHPISRRLSELI